MRINLNYNNQTNKHRWFTFIPEKITYINRITAVVTISNGIILSLHHITHSRTEPVYPDANATQT